jgi:WD40 repeat protein
MSQNNKINKASTKILLAPKPQHQIVLSEYVTAIAWDCNGKYIAAATASGEVSLMDGQASKANLQPLTLQAATEQAIDCLGFSADGRWFAAGGQDSKIRVWDLSHNPPAIAATIDLNSGASSTKKLWIEHLAWHPHRAEFAFSFGKYIQVWSAETLDIVTTLDFAQSTVLAIAWHPSGEYLTASGDGGIKVWQQSDWYADPILFELPTAAAKILWNHAGQYLVASTLDHLVVVIQWLSTDFDPSPWRMQGFPGKIRSFAWSNQRSPLLASSSGTDVVIWERHADPNVGWEGEVIKGHNSIVGAVAFNSSSEYLATADENGRIAIWDKSLNWIQALDTPMSEITALQWQPKGKKLAAANGNGEIMLWTASSQGKGFR